MLPWGPRLRRDGLVPWGLAQLGNIEMTLLQTVPSRVIKKKERGKVRGQETMMDLVRGLNKAKRRYEEVGWSVVH